MTNDEAKKLADVAKDIMRRSSEAQRSHLEASLRRDYYPADVALTAISQFAEANEFISTSGILAILKSMIPRNAGVVARVASAEEIRRRREAAEKPDESVLKARAFFEKYPDDMRDYRAALEEENPVLASWWLGKETKDLPVLICMIYARFACVPRAARAGAA